MDSLTLSHNPLDQNSYFGLGNEHPIFPGQHVVVKQTAFDPASHDDKPKLDDTPKIDDKHKLDDKPNLDEPSSILMHLAMLHKDRRRKVTSLEHLLVKQAEIANEVNGLQDDIRKMDNEHDRLLDSQAEEMGYY